MRITRTYRVEYRGNYIGDIVSENKKMILDDFRLKNHLAGYRKYMLKMVEITQISVTE